MIAYTLFVVDDEESIREAVTFGLKRLYTVHPFASAEEALAAAGKTPPDLILLDIGLPGMSGIEALAEIKRIHPAVLVIMITAVEDIETVVAAMRAGAHDYVVKPLHLDTIKVSVANALETIRLRKEVQELQAQCLRDQVPCFIAESDAIQDVMQFVEKVARSPDTPVLILGETGTGKELISRAIHYQSPNYSGPFVSINCAAIPKELIESELFGYEKGAFSGAAATGKKGLVEEAADGTLFLDEVGDLSHAAQAKLLRFLEEGEYYRLGGSRKLHVNTRIVSATNKNLEKMIDEDQFRQDLYYRLAVVKVAIPSLTERPEDIMPIANSFLDEFSRKYDKQISGFTAGAERGLKACQWKGNIRELRNYVERGVLVGNGPLLTPEDLGLCGAPAAPDSDRRADFPPLPSQGLDLEKLEEHYIREAFQRAGGNESKAARLLNLSYYSFRYRRKKLPERA